MRTPYFGRLSAAVGLTFAMALFPGCPPVGGSEGGAGGATGTLPPEVSQCVTMFPQDYPDTRDIDIGTGLGAAFTPYGTSESVTLYEGNQGLTMITPSIRVAALASEGEDACFRVILENDYQGAIPDSPHATDTLQSNVHFLRQGDSFVSDGYLYDASSYSGSLLKGIDLKLTLTVQGPSFQSQKVAIVTLQ